MIEQKQNSQQLCKAKGRGCAKAKANSIIPTNTNLRTLAYCAIYCAFTFCCLDLEMITISNINIITPVSATQTQTSQSQSQSLSARQHSKYKVKYDRTVINYGGHTWVKENGNCYKDAQPISCDEYDKGISGVTYCACMGVSSCVICWILTVVGVIVVIIVIIVCVCGAKKAQEQRQIDRAAELNARNNEPQTTTVVMQAQPQQPMMQQQPMMVQQQQQPVMMQPMQQPQDQPPQVVYAQPAPQGDQVQQQESQLLLTTCAGGNASADM